MARSLQCAVAMRIHALFTSLVFAAACGATPVTDDPDVPDVPDMPDGTIGTARIYDAAHTLREVEYRVADGRKMWGDIDLGPAFLRADATSDLSQRWPGGVVHWVNNSQHLGSAQMQTINQAITELQTRTPVSFVPTLPASGPYLSLIDNPATGTGGISSCVGTENIDTDMQSTHADPCTIAFPIDVNQITALHEFGHLFGFFHEQQRADRNTYVDVDSNASCTDDAGDLAPITTGAEEIGNYDFASAMEYSSFNACNTNAAGNCTCLPTLKKGSWTIDHTGNVTSSNPGFIPLPSDLSVRDVRALNRMYEPTLGSDEAGDRDGAAVVVADFNNDGVLDIAIGSPGEAPGSSAAGGAVFLYMGNLSGPTNWKVLTVKDFGDTPVAGDSFGAALFARDVDGDGFPELFVGTPGRGNGAGAVYLYRGDHDGLGAPKPTQKITQGNSGAGEDEAGDNFGTAMAGGKLDGGTTEELAIGTPGETPSGSSFKSGYVYVFQWTTDGSAGGLLTGSAGFAKYSHVSDPSPSNGDRFGAALIAPTIGGPRHLIVGAPGADTAYVYSSTMTLQQTINGTTGSQLGSAFAAADFDGDGYSDVAIGAPSYNSGSGMVEVFLGSSSGTLSYAGFRQETDMLGTSSDEASDHFGAALAAGDVDGDGRAELFVGIPNRITGGVRAGEVAEFTTTSSSALLASLWIYNDPNVPTAGDQFGAALDVGSIDPSGEPGVVFGAPGLTIGSKANAGAMFYALGTTGSALFSIPSIVQRDQASSLGKR